MSIIETNVTITNRVGLHARPARLLVQTAAQFQSQIQVRRGEKTANAKSIVGVLKLGAVMGGPEQDSLGVQREIARDFVLSADFAYRHFVHLPVGIDLNHFNSIRGPVIPVCTAAQRNDPLAICSVGQITVQANQARSTYKGLLLRAEKRFSHGFQVLGSSPSRI